MEAASRDVGLRAVALLGAAGVEIGAGLSRREFDEIAARFGFEFGDDHRAMLTAGLPLGERWVDWRAATDLWTRLDQPVAGILAHVDPPHGFWRSDWGPQPATLVAARRVAETRLRRWPRLVPIYGHRYTEAAPSPTGASVLSIVGTDVVSYGADLVDYLGNEFHEADPRDDVTLLPRPVPPWTSLDEDRVVIRRPHAGP